MRVYITGADGMLGKALITALAQDPRTTDWPVRGVSINDFDISDTAALESSIDNFRPDIVVHTAAHAIVDECEADLKLALRVNVGGVHNIVNACRRNGSKLVYLSSDYVFDGKNPLGDAYRETDVPNPVSVYGLTKLAGERTAALLPDHLNIRTSWLFGGDAERTDNVLHLVRKAMRGERVQLITDQYSLPTYTVDLAQAMTFLLATAEPPTGTIHVANSGSASWYEVGNHVLRFLDPERADTLAPESLAFSDCVFVGDRPRNSTLNVERLAELGYQMPSWQNAVERFCLRILKDAPSMAMAAAL